MDPGDRVEFVTRDGAPLVARRLNRGDRAALQDFFCGLSAKSLRWFQAHALDDETVTKALIRSENGEDLTLGLFEGTRIKGYFFLWYFRERTPLLGIGLADGFQGRGLGRKLTTFLIEIARKNGAAGIELTTMQDNDRAFALYERVGFKFYKDVENLQGDGNIVIERAMFYPIEPDAKPMEKAHEPPV